MITPKITNLGYSNLWTDMSTILGYTSNFEKLITKLFANGEQGFAYDPNDLSTMWQDANGTIPVTAAGQPVGLIRDKSGRNNHAYQTTSASRPILRKNAITGANYLEFDGSDDFLRTNNIDFTATDQVSLFAGVRKLSDATTGMVAEFSPFSTSNNGTFALYAPYDTTFKGYGFRSRYSASSDANTVSPLSPSSSVLAGHGDIYGDKSQLKINGLIVAKNVSDQGAGNYGNYPLYIGRRGGTSLPFNGHLYSLIGIGRLTTDSETKALEKSIAKNTGVVLNV